MFGYIDQFGGALNQFGGGQHINHSSIQFQAVTMPKCIRTPQPSSSSSSDSVEGISKDTLDPSKCMNLLAHHYYWDVLVGKTFMPERGLKPNQGDGKILDQIRQYGWLSFVCTPCSAPMVVVREFYANSCKT